CRLAAGGIVRARQRNQPGHPRPAQGRVHHPRGHERLEAPRRERSRPSGHGRDHPVPEETDLVTHSAPTGAQLRPHEPRSVQDVESLWVLAAFMRAAITFYLLYSAEHEAPGDAAHQLNPVVTVVLVLLFAVVGMGGSYAVAWYGIRVNTYANARTAFASLRG